MNSRFDPREAWARLGTIGKVATGAIALMLVVMTSVVPAFVRALLAPSAETQSSAEGDKELAAKTKEKFPGYLAQIEGRSLFLKPGPPIKETSKPPDDLPSENSEKQRPTSYGGPALVAMMGDTVWFDNGKRMQAGGDKEGDLRVVSLNIPWDATIEWQEVEFKVGLFKKDDLVIQAKAKEAPQSDSKETPAAPADSPDEEAIAKPPQPAEQPRPKVATGEVPASSGSADPAKPVNPAPAAVPTVEPVKPGSS